MATQRDIDALFAKLDQLGDRFTDIVTTIARLEERMVPRSEISQLIELHAKNCRAPLADDKALSPALKRAVIAVLIPLGAILSVLAGRASM